MNKGDIAAEWSLQAPYTPFAEKFLFSPTSGNLDIKDSVTLVVDFESDILGEFCENFSFCLKGNDDPLTCQFKGHVIGPTFQFDVEEIDFGVISYDCPVSATAVLENTSDISMSWRARIPQDGAYRKREFTINPDCGSLVPGQRQSILVELMSQTVKVYECYLTVDVDTVGEELLSLPLKAKCEVPLVELESSDLKYGECFVRFHESRAVVLINTSTEITGLFRVVPQDPSTYSLARVSPEPEEGQAREKIDEEKRSGLKGG
ncbi:unnamed protein product [Discosporangium mesarthrocarpum]